VRWRKTAEDETASVDMIKCEWRKRVLRLAATISMVRILKISKITRILFSSSLCLPMIAYIELERALSSKPVHKLGQVLRSV
jgi:hypothetical protein